MEATYQVVFRGKLLTGFDQETVECNLAALFKSDRARIRALLAQPKVVLKSGISRDDGTRYEEALRKAGLMVALISESPESAADFTSAATATPAQAEAAAPPTASTAAEPTLAEVGAILSDVSRPASFSVNTEHFTLADVGALIDTSARLAAPKEYDLSKLSVAPVGEVLAEKTSVAPPAVDLSGLSLAPLEDAPKPDELSDFWRKAERE